MGTWKVSLRYPILVEVEVEAEDEIEAYELAENLADWQTEGEEDGEAVRVDAIEAAL